MCMINITTWLELCRWLDIILMNFANTSHYIMKSNSLYKNFKQCILLRIKVHNLVDFYVVPSYKVLIPYFVNQENVDTEYCAFCVSLV